MASTRRTGCRFKNNRCTRAKNGRSVKHCVLNKKKSKCRKRKTARKRRSSRKRQSSRKIRCPSNKKKVSFVANGKRITFCAKRRRKRTNKTPSHLRPYVEYMIEHGHTGKKRTVMAWWRRQ